MEKIILTTLNKTLINKEAGGLAIKRNNIKFIKSLNKNVIIATRHRDYYVKRTLKLLNQKNNYISYYGSKVVHNNNVVKSVFLDKINFEKLYFHTLFDFSKITFSIYDEKNRILMSSNFSKYFLFLNSVSIRKESNNFYNKIKIKDKFTNKLFNSNQKIYKAEIRCEENSRLDNIKLNLEKNFGSFFDFVLAKDKIEIFAKDIDMFSSIEYLLNKMNIKKEDVIFLGSEQNDYHIAKNFENSICYEDSPAKLKKECKNTLRDLKEIIKYIGP